jgi:hypothetical protein
VPEPGREAVTISDALLRAIDRLRSKLDDYALGMGSQMAASNLPNSSYALSAPSMQHTGQQQRQAVLQPRLVRPALPRLLGGMGSGSPLCTISVHDPAKGGDAMKWCSYDHTSYGQPQPSAASVAAATTLAAQGGARGGNSVRAGARRSSGAAKKKK